LSAKGATVTEPGLRASDADRQRVVTALERHTAAGRLSLDEFAHRVGRVFAAVTYADLAAVTRDLPSEPAVPSQHRQLLLAFGLALLTLAVLGVILAIAR
jgi:uncharacterized protein DUF1707